MLPLAVLLCATTLLTVTQSLILQFPLARTAGSWSGILPGAVLTNETYCHWEAECKYCPLCSFPRDLLTRFLTLFLHYSVKILHRFLFTAWPALSVALRAARFTPNQNTPVKAEDMRSSSQRSTLTPHVHMKQASSSIHKRTIQQRDRSWKSVGASHAALSTQRFDPARFLFHLNLTLVGIQTQ